MIDSNKKLAFFLPNTFTALNMACGFAGIMMALQNKFYFACMAIALGAVFDSVDGRVARITGTQSSFGEQFDSLSDLISFGIAPALIFYLRFFTESGRIGVVVAFLYLLAGALRLARFNANIDKVNSDYFQGLPIPGSAASVIGYVFLSLTYPALQEITILAYIYLIFYSFLMISNIPFYSFKKAEWVKKYKKQIFLLIVVTFALIAMYEEIMLLVVFSVYVFVSIFHYIKNKEKFLGVLEYNDDTSLDDNSTN
ncbi:CDP-diacylglycerol--serine O-phosphatidyltransferase [Bacteriovoracaceae bacterium]|nr:CDP-diacylglycerol--serine O-phosphatidyltransferase [Bacteriovoracaceae bacterium]